MEKKPMIFNFLSLLFLSIALGIPLQIMALYQHDLSSFLLIMSKITDLNWIMISFSIVISIGLYKVNKYVLFVMPILIISVFINNYFVSKLGFDFSQNETLLASILFLIPAVYIYKLDILDCLLAPQAHWWKRGPRRNIELNASIEGLGISMKHLKTFDISNTGAFILLSESEIKELSKFENRGKLKLNFSLSNNEVLYLDASLIRAGANKGHYPAGVGVRFNNVKLGNKWNLFRLTSDSLFNSFIYFYIVLLF